jgi:hypothetical protein
MNVRYNSNLAFVDLLFNLILGFAFLFIVAFFLINDPTEDKDVEAKVEYMIIMDWDGKRDIDMDLWVQGPSGLVGFRSPNIGYVNLDRDDLGHRNDTIINKTTKKREIVRINREVINVRGFQTGEYIINAHWFLTREEKVKQKPLDVNIQVIKLNPYKEIYTGSKEFTWKGQEQTFTRFSMKEDGNYWKMNSLPKNLVLRPSSSSYSNDPAFPSYSTAESPSGTPTTPRGVGVSRQAQDDEGNP